MLAGQLGRTPIAVREKRKRLGLRRCDRQTLSAAEQEVALLAAAGWPNTAIGVRRGTATKTTDAQMSSIFQKLMINSREDIVRFVPQDQRDRVSAERARFPRQSPDKPRSIHPRLQN